jgi:hypothetical protein
MRVVGVAMVLCLVSVATLGCDDSSDPTDQVAELRREVDEQQRRHVRAEREARDLADENRRLALELDRLHRNESAAEQTAMSIPNIGSITWRCNDARRFEFTFRPESGSVTVISSIDGETERRTVHPGRVFSTPFVSPDTHLEWTVTYEHKPATISAGVFVDPAVDQGACFIRNATLERTEAPN